MNMKLFFVGAVLASAASVAAVTPSNQTSAADITPTHGLKIARLCTFQRGGEGIFDGLGKLRYKQSLRLERRISGLDLAIEGRRSSRPDPSGGVDIEEVTVGTPVRPLRMHGLPLRSFAVGFDQQAESDGSSWRELRLRGSPAQVRGMLGKVGVKVPTRGYHEIKDDHPCGGALSVQGKAGETSIRCSWGC